MPGSRNDVLAALLRNETFEVSVRSPALSFELKGNLNFIGELTYQTVNRTFIGPDGKRLKIRYRLQIQGLGPTTDALNDGLYEGWLDLNYLVLSELQEILRSFIEGRMRNLGMNKQGRTLSRGKQSKYFNRFGRLPPGLRISNAKLRQGGVTKPFISAFMNMGDRNTATNNRVGAPHSVFVEYGFTDRAGRKHAPRPIFKLARANMPAMKALAVSRVEAKAIKAISQAVMSKLKTYS